MKFIDLIMVNIVLKIVVPWLDNLAKRTETEIDDKIVDVLSTIINAIASPVTIQALDRNSNPKDLNQK